MNKFFDGSKIEISSSEVTVTEGVKLTLTSDKDLVKNAAWHVAGGVRAGSIDQWTADRIVFCFGIAQRAIAMGR